MPGEKAEMKPVLNIALLGESFVEWGGGLDFLRFCANALVHKSNKRSLKIYLLIPENDTRFIPMIKNVLRPCKNMLKDIIQLKKPVYKKYEPLTRDQVLDSIQNIDSNIKVIYYDKANNGLKHCIISNNIDVVCPTANPLDIDFPVPWIGYIDDFQYKYYPEFFSAKEIKYRNSRINKILSTSKAVIVNSMAVKDDVFRFYPDTDCNVFNLPYSPVPALSWLEESTVDVKTKYQLPERYFLISNQFWVHKSHITAFEALAGLEDSGDIHIVCTGKTEDYRCPPHFGDLLKKIKELGLDGRVHFLGYIPKRDQILIMLHSIAVLQPSLFEGGPGGGAVYDAVAMGVPAIVSDIPVNLEISEENIWFFKAGLAEDLGARMVEVLSSEIQRPDKNVLFEKGKSRIEMFGDRLLESIDYVMEKSDV